ncbi:GTPase/DUF3482 domain-containing protein [Variovorax sp. RHLX14]|uniref:GTPase/DUF3482 domain-containing protein n=1 Tax=Variovorax sp. RHLX14 TaxID=1259731 RepID=UPI003F48F23B
MNPIRIAVVGHTNAGKTSLLRTLTRRVDFGEVSQRPGTTRHVERVDLRIQGRVAVRFFDTPGLEDAVSLREHIARIDQVSTPPDRIRRFLEGPEAHGSFEQEAKVLRTLLDADAAFLVIDAREPVLPKFRDEIELIGSCARPVLPVLNFVRDARSREAEWRALLAAYGLHAVVRFDAAAPFVGAERDLYQDLVTLLRERRAELGEIAAFLDNEVAGRRRDACTRIAELLIDAAATRRTVAASDFADPARREPAVAALRQAIADKAQRCASDLLALYGFRENDASESPLPALEGRWSMDFFSPEAMKDAGVRLGQGAAVGAALGVMADVALGGLSLGAGAALGGTLGGAVMQGWGPLGRKLANRLRDVRELSVEDPVLMVLLAWQLDLLCALENRGHAATQRLALDASESGSRWPAARLADVVRELRPARSHPEWESNGRGAQRMTLVHNVATSVSMAFSNASVP